jgi:hypothetical protein
VRHATEPDSPEARFRLGLTLGVVPAVLVLAGPTVLGWVWLVTVGGCVAILGWAAP